MSCRRFLFFVSSKKGEPVTFFDPRSTLGQLPFSSYFFVLLFIILLPFCFWRVDEFGGEERSGLPPNSFILIILAPI